MDLFTGLQEMMTGAETDDEAAIKEVCFRETFGGRERRPDLVSSSWLHSEDSRLIAIFAGAGLFLRNGWSDIESTLISGRDGTGCNFTHEDHLIRVRGDMAWVTFVETNYARTDHRRMRGSKLFQQRVLERIGGEWKISCLICMPKRNQQHDRSHILVDAAGKVQRISDEMRAAISDMGLKVSDGRIRAARRRHDADLQATISRAAKLASFQALASGDFDQDVHGQATRKEFPVMLGKDDLGGQRHCMVLIQDAEVYIGLDDPDLMVRRIETANVIYGLSSTQLQIAGEIVRGLSLPTIAENLGISPNTARTHLKRTFEKMGVSSQAALVRCLLTVGR